MKYKYKATFDQKNLMSLEIRSLKYYFTVGTALKTAEFDGFGIIEINMPTLIAEEGNQPISMHIQIHG